jgi:uncharacterized RDD family membrane protein YckC
MNNYAGFWLRFVALIIDWLILGVVNWIILLPVLAAVGFSAASSFPFSGLTSPDELDVAALVGSLTAMFGIAWLFQKLVELLYHSLLEASKFQGSFGKVALGIIVTDTDGNKLDFTKALVRNVCKFISSAIIGVGYIMAGFTEKKQGLHDIIAGTLVVMKPKTPAA